MAVGLKLGSITDEVGTSDFFYAFFSTVSRNLEPKGWGTRFPTLMNELYAGQLDQADASRALAELDKVRSELAALPVSKLVWDIEDSSKMPPWGDDIAETITDLSNYFVTSTGRDLIDTIHEVLKELSVAGGVVKVISY